MARFNQAAESKATRKTQNFAGGEAYVQSTELELVSLLLTSFANDTFYEKADKRFDRLKELISKCDPLFVAKAAVYARREFGMRSITHVAASELSKYTSGKPWAGNFFNQVVFRPDDITEILSYHFAQKYKLPHAMRKGFGLAFGKFDAYQLAKYRAEKSKVRLVDAVQIIHPPKAENAQAIEALVKGTLQPAETWETQLSLAGSNAGSEDEKVSMKKDVWVKLVKEKKLGYLALLRNLRNISEQAPEVLNEALQSLTNEAFIKKSLVFPFQFLVAYKQFMNSNTRNARLIADALAKAVDISCQNVKTLGFEGNTLVAVDNSSSMDDSVTGSEHMNRSELGALFGIVLAKAVNADIMEWGDFARYMKYSLSTSSMDFAAGFHEKNKVGHGTAVGSIFANADKKYNRILIFSDMQSWKGYHTPDAEFKAYKNRFGADPFVYSFDLAGHGTMQFPENKVMALAGFSDKIFTIMSMLEKDRKALVNQIKAVEL